MEKEPLELTLERYGTYGDRDVRGWRHTNERGQVKWRIRTWLKDGTPMDEYWVMNRKFYEFIPVNDTGAAMGRLITDMEDGKKKNVLDAIANWESQVAENPRV
jgi:hypothetical protein